MLVYGYELLCEKDRENVCERVWVLCERVWVLCVDFHEYRYTPLIDASVCVFCVVHFTSIASYIASFPGSPSSACTIIAGDLCAWRRENMYVYTSD